jgi:hypothetical protein
VCFCVPDDLERFFNAISELWAELDLLKRKRAQQKNDGMLFKINCLGAFLFEMEWAQDGSVI